MMTVKNGKKEYFVVGKPTQLAYLIAQQKKETERRDKILADILPSLSTYRTGGEKILMECYRGPTAIQMIQKLLQNNKEEVLELVPLDKVRKFIPEIFPGDIRETFSKKFSIRSLYSTKAGPHGKKKQNVDYRFLPPERFPFSAEFIIFGDHVSLSTFEDDVSVIIITDKQIADTFKMLFEGLWLLGEK